VSATLLKRSNSGGAARARQVARSRRHFRLRKKISGTAERPRLVVTRSLRHVVAQLVDDLAGHTIASASSMDVSIRGAEGTKTDIAKRTGELLAGRALEAGVTKVVFDRGGNKYTGRVAALADAARSAGLEF